MIKGTSVKCLFESVLCVFVSRENYRTLLGNTVDDRKSLELILLFLK